MKHLFCILAILAITMSTAAFADHTRVKVYDQQGRYDGQIVQDGARVKSYDRNGRFSGQDVMQSDGRTVYTYDRNGRYTGQYRVENAECPRGIRCR